MLFLARVKLEYEKEKAYPQICTADTLFGFNNQIGSA